MKANRKRPAARHQRPSSSAARQRCPAPPTTTAAAAAEGRAPPRSRPPAAAEPPAAPARRLRAPWLPGPGAWGLPPPPLPSPAAAGALQAGRRLRGTFSLVVSSSATATAHPKLCGGLRSGAARPGPPHRTAGSMSPCPHPPRTHTPLPHPKIIHRAGRGAGGGAGEGGSGLPGALAALPARCPRTPTARLPPAQRASPRPRARAGSAARPYVREKHVRTGETALGNDLKDTKLTHSCAQIQHAV